jgi:hypothetical protein
MTHESPRPLLATPLAGLSDDDVLAKGQQVFRELVIGELRRALHARIGIAAMILACCAIDFLTTLFAGKGSTDKRFQQFVEKFLPRYDAKNLRLMRHALVHEYVIQRDKSYAFSVGRERASEHLQQNRIIVDLLVDDIEQAGGQLFEQAVVDHNVRRHVLKRLRNPGLVLMEPEDLLPTPHTHEA